MNLPHTFKRSVDGTLNEETTFTDVAVNPKIDAKKFAVSK